MFFAAGVLLGIVSLAAFASVVKERAPRRRASHFRAFLADKKRALAYYNKLSSVYDVLNPHLYTSSMREEITNQLRSNEELSILDVGCGTGYTTKGILQLPNLREAVGVDQNLRQLQKALRNLRSEKTSLSLSRGEVENLPFSDETFDAVVSVGAVEYFSDPEKALKEMTRVAKHGGRVIVGGPQFEWFKKFFLHRLFYTLRAEDLNDIFHRAGLKAATSLMTGLDTLFGTSDYVLVVSATKA